MYNADMGRNDKGLGTVYQKGDQWVGRLRYKDELHNQKEKSFLCDTKEEAEKKLKAFRESLLKGEVNPGTPMTFGEWSETAMRTVYKPKLRPNTYALYEGFLTHHLSVLDKVPLNKITPAMCDSVIAGLKKTERSYEKDGSGEVKISVMREKPLSGQSKTLVRRFLIGLLNHAVRVGYLKENPANRTLAPLKVAKRERVLTVEEVKTLLEKAGNPLYRAMFSFQILLGLRIGEVLGIKWSDLEQVSGKEGEGPCLVVHIRQQMQRNRVAKKVMAVELKTERAHRTLEVPEELAQLLNDIERRGEFVFSTNLGTPIEPRNAQRTLDTLSKKAGLGKVTTHSLRRTSASLHHQAGTGLGILMGILGHTDIRTTMIYVKTSLAANREANAKLSKLLG